MSDLKLFLTSWPNGTLRPVKTLGPHPNIRGGIYIRYLDEKGGTNTTTSDFLFDMPDLTYPKEQVDELIKIIESNAFIDDHRIDVAIAKLHADGTGEG